MSSRSDRIEGDRTDEEIIADLADRDDVIGEVFSELQSSTCSRKEETNS